jgi:hypothetical protein
MLSIAKDSKIISKLFQSMARLKSSTYLCNVVGPLFHNVSEMSYNLSLCRSEKVEKGIIRSCHLGMVSLNYPSNHLIDTVFLRTCQAVGGTIIHHQNLEADHFWHFRAVSSRDLC